jgi:uncharacterized DUF497 family protein
MNALGFVLDPAKDRANQIISARKADHQEQEAYWS